MSGAGAEGAAGAPLPELAELIGRLERVERQLVDAAGGAASGEAPSERRVEGQRLGEEIVALHRDAEALQARVAELQVAVREMAGRYRAAFPRGVRADPAAAGTASPPALRIDHLGASTFLERAWSHLANGEHDAAIGSLREALARVPGDAQATTLLGWARAAAGQGPEAVSTLEGVLRANPDHALARTALGLALQRCGEPRRAIEELSRVLRSGSSDRRALSYANLYLGVVYAEREMFRDARRFLASAIELSPNLIEAFWELGRTYRREGDGAGAREAWGRGAAARRFSAWGERCEAALREMESEEETLREHAVPPKEPGT